MTALLICIALGSAYVAGIATGLSCERDPTEPPLPTPDAGTRTGE